MRSIGLDVHKHFAEVAVAESGSKVRSGGCIAATPMELKAFAATLGPHDQVVPEATFNIWAIAELLQRRAGRLIVSNPMRTKAIASAKVKTDEADAAIWRSCWPLTSSRRRGPTRGPGKRGTV